MSTRAIILRRATTGATPARAARRVWTICLAAALVTLTGCAGERDRSTTGPTEADAAFGRGGKPAGGGGGGESGVAGTALAGLSKRGRSRAAGINGSGTVVGWSTDARGGQLPVRWFPAGAGWGTPQPLSAPGGGAARAINEAGYVAGYISVDGEPIAAIWTPAGHRVDLGPGSASDIDEENTVIGSVEGVGAVAWRYSDSTGDWIRDVLPGEYGTTVLGIGDGRMAVGRVPDGFSERAVVWTRSGVAWSGPTPLSQAAHAGSFAREAAGTRIVGGVWLTLDGFCASTVATVWDTSAAQPTLIQVPGSIGSALNDVSLSGEVVGESRETCPGAPRAFWWSSNAGLKWLLPLRSSESVEALAIAPFGFVAGVSYDFSRSRAVVWRVH